jgi:hypothetical protein
MSAIDVKCFWDDEAQEMELRELIEKDDKLSIGDTR